MQSLMFLDCFVQKLWKKNLWGVGSIPPPFGKEGLIWFSKPVQEKSCFD